MTYSKMTRQLKLYYYLISTEYHGPDDLTLLFGYPNIRMIQRDMKDLRDCGLVADIKYDRREKNYIITGEYSEISSGIPKRRLEHLIRLRRLGTIVTEFEPTDEYELSAYEDELDAYKWDMEEYNSDPEGFIENWGEKPVEPESMKFFDVKKAYYKLFPDSNERKRQRDFKELREAGYNIEYRRDLKAYVIIDEMKPEEY
ncbi:MAG: hypothetical protein IK093_08185 [Ruminiclostridium sp.]|nr:hypothetical protein [Ruminiclostridium sp.]